MSVFSNTTTSDVIQSYAVAMIVFLYTCICGFGRFVTVSNFSPSNPIDVIAIMSFLYSSMI